MTFLFTQGQFDQLGKIIQQREKELVETLKIKGDVGSTSDAWHSSVFQALYLEEMQLRKRLAELKTLALSAKIIEPQEQNNFVDIGNGVVVEYDDGSLDRLILDGYIIGDTKNRVSVYSPLGKVLQGAKKGETRVFQAGDKERKVTVVEILFPLQAKNFKGK